MILIDKTISNRVIYTASGTQSTTCVQVTLLEYASNIETANGVKRFRVRTYYELQASNKLA